MRKILCILICTFLVSFWSNGVHVVVRKEGRGPMGKGLLCMHCAANHPDSSLARFRPSLTAICSTSWDQSVVAGKYTRAPAQPHSSSCWAGTAPACLVEVGGKELKDSWAGCVINSLHDWCTTWLIMSQLKRRQEKGKYFQTHFLVHFHSARQTAREPSARHSSATLSFLESSRLLVWHWGRERVMKLLT